MLDQANKLTLKYFIIIAYGIFLDILLTSTDEMYDPITTLRRNNRLVKHMPGTAF